MKLFLCFELKYNKVYESSVAERLASRLRINLSVDLSQKTFGEDFSCFSKIWSVYIIRLIVTAFKQTAFKQT